MKKILAVLLMICVNLYANLNDDGMAEFQKGNYQKASKLFKKACDRGNMNGCNNLGFLYANGNGVTQNFQIAKQLYKKACDGGSMDACNSLGILYYKGRGVLKNIRIAKELFKKACYGGNQIGCNAYKILTSHRY